MKSICVCQEAKSMGTKGSWREWTDEGSGGGGGEGREGQRGGRSGLCKLIFPLFSFQLQIASESGLKYTHEFFDSFLHDRAKFSIF